MDLAALARAGDGVRGRALPAPATRHGEDDGHRAALAAAALCVAGMIGPTTGAITQVVVSAAQRAGGWLEEIGQLPRHRSALTTAIYAKVD